MPPSLLFYAIPFFILLLGIEAWLSYREKKELYETKDTFSSLALGTGNVVIGLVTKAIAFGVYSLIYQFRFFTLDPVDWWVWVLCFFADDFSYYWFHRISHGVGWFWASHVVHHSSQKYNLAAALRQTWTGTITGSFLFWAWMPMVGFHPIMVAMFQSISLIYQFWIHTETIGKLHPVIEAIFNTPSHHRVHHGSDLKYLDRNHAGILIIWDRLFGTFQAEEERPTYGLTTNVGTFNPFCIAFFEWRQLYKKVKNSGSFTTAFKYLTYPPGWSPDGSSKTAKQLRTQQRPQNTSL